MDDLDKAKWLIKLDKHQETRDGPVSIPPDPALAVAHVLIDIAEQFRLLNSYVGEELPKICERLQAIEDALGEGMT